MLQGTASLTQFVSLSAGKYAVNFVAAQRGNQQSTETFRVLIDGKVVGTFNSLTGIGYTMLTTASVDLTDGTHSITFEGTNLNGGDNTVFLDHVSLTQGWARFPCNWFAATEGSAFPKKRSLRSRRIRISLSHFRDRCC